jgi:hypothetical protein
VMDRGRLVRAQSALVLARARSQEAIDRYRPVRRSVSLSRVSAYRPSSIDVSRDMWMTEKYRPRRYRRDWDLFDDYWHDRYYYMTPYYWDTYRYSRRNYYLDPPYSIRWWYPGLWGYGTRYRWQTGNMWDPLYWRRYRDPTYDRPLWFGYRPWAWESMDTDRALRMYKSGLISFSALDRHWLTPSAIERRTSNYWKDLYIPTGYYGTRRWYYSWA